MTSHFAVRFPLPRGRATVRLWVRVRVRVMRKSELGNVEVDHHQEQRSGGLQVSGHRSQPTGKHYKYSLADNTVLQFHTATDALMIR